MVWLRRIAWAAFWLVWGLSVLGLALLAVATGGWLTRYNDRVTLPNGFILKREFELWFDDRDDMFAADGRTVLARDVEFLCFNDSFAWLTSYERGHAGLYDAATQSRVRRGKFEEMLEKSGLQVQGKTCNGYFTAMLGPGLLYDDGPESPFLPRCSRRNLGNAALSDRSWLERPCRADDWPTGAGGGGDEP